MDTEDRDRRRDDLGLGGCVQRAALVRQAVVSGRPACPRARPAPRPRQGTRRSTCAASARPLRLTLTHAHAPPPVYAAQSAQWPRWTLTRRRRRPWRVCARCVWAVVRPFCVVAPLRARGRAERARERRRRAATGAQTQREAHASGDGAGGRSTALYTGRARATGAQAHRRSTRAEGEIDSALLPSVALSLCLCAYLPLTRSVLGSVSL